MHRNAKLTPAGRRILVDRIASGRPAAHVAAEMGVARKPATSGGAAGWPRARPACRTDRAGRGALPPACRLGSSARSSGCDGAASSAPCASAGGWAWPAPPCIACSAGSASTASPGSTARPDGSSDACTSTPGLETCSTSTSRSWAASPQAAAGARTAAAATAMGATAASVTPTSTPPSTTTPVSPTARFWPTSARSPRSRSGSARAAGSPSAASASGPCSPTTVRATAAPTSLAPAWPPASRHRRTRPYRPQTNGKVERFNRTLLEEWAYVRVYRSEAARTAARGTSRRPSSRGCVRNVPHRRREGDFEVVGRASNGQEAVDRAPALRPAVVLMDLRMREMDGVEAMRQNAGRRNPADDRRGPGGLPARAARADGRTRLLAASGAHAGLPKRRGRPCALMRCAGPRLS